MAYRKRTRNLEESGLSETVAENLTEEPTEEPEPKVAPEVEIEATNGEPTPKATASGKAVEAKKREKPVKKFPRNTPKFSRRVS